MSSLNKVMIIGNLGKNPEVRLTQGGGKVASLNVATTEKWNNKTTGAKEAKTEWHSMVVFGKGAEIVEKYLHKGSKAYFEGKLQTRKWTDKNNQERYTTEIVVDNFTMLDGRRDDVTPHDAQPTSAPKQISTDAPFDDDIPF